MKFMPRFRRSMSLGVLLSASLGIAFSPPAQAITITYSETTQRPAPLFEFRGNYDLPFNLNINGSAAFAPDLASFVTPIASSSASSGNVLRDLINNAITVDTLTDLNLNLGYKIDLFDLNALIGQISGNIMPYAGYRHYFTYTINQGDQITSNAGGPNYGARFNLGLPLGFTGYAYAEASTLLGGQYEFAGNSSELQTQNLTLPAYGLGVNWTLPIFNAASLYAGYRGFFLPADLRQGASYSGDLELIHGLSFGGSILFFGI